MSLVNRWYQILNIFEATPTIDQQSLCQYLKTSKATVRKNIQLLNNELQDIAFISFDNQFYRLDILNHSRYQEILAGELRYESDFNSASKRSAFILKTLFASEANVTIAELSEILNVSRGTVGNDLNKVREILAEYKGEIVGVPNKGLHLSGDNTQLALLYCHYILDYFPIEKIDLDLEERLLAYANSMGLNNEASLLLIRAVETVLSMYQFNRRIIQPIDFYTNFVDEEAEFSTLISMLEEVLEIDFNAFEVEFLSFPLNVYNQEDRLSKSYTSHFIPLVFDVILNEVYATFAIEIDQEKMYEDIKFHLHYLVNRLATHTELNDVFLEALSERYPLSHEVAKVAGHVVSELIGHSISDSEIDYLTIYFEMAINEPLSVENKEVAVVCHTGRGTAKMIEQHFKRALGSHVKVVSLAAHQLSVHSLNRYFAIFTTIPLRIRDIKVPVVYINNLFDESLIREEWYRLERNNQLEIKKLTLELQDLVYEDNYYGYLTKMSSYLWKLKLVDADFSFRIFERENLQSTIFDQGIAMPHAIQTRSDQIILNVGRIKSENSNNNKVELIFMIGIPESENEEIESSLITIYDFIFKVANSQALKTRLKTISENQDLIKMILET
ncbi:BglG family transcription antiterminator [Hutsoniella sourekii]